MKLTKNKKYDKILKKIRREQRKRVKSDYNRLGLQPKG